MVVPRTGSDILEAAAALRESIASHQEEIERERRVPRSVVDDCRDAGLYRMLVPRELGGAEVDQLTFMRAIELVSESDGSVGWNLGTSSAGALTSLSFPDDGIHEVYADGPDVVFSGSIAPGGGQAVRTVQPGGYRHRSGGAGCVRGPRRCVLSHSVYVPPAARNPMRRTKRGRSAGEK